MTRVLTSAIRLTEPFLPSSQAVLLTLQPATRRFVAESSVFMPCVRLLAGTGAPAHGGPGSRLHTCV